MNILIAALMGAAGAGLGALLAGLVAKTLRADDRVRRGVVLVSAIVATALSQVLFRLSIEPHVKLWQAETELKKLPVYNVLIDHYPESYARMRGKLLQAIETGADPVSAANAARVEVGSAVQQALPTADPSNLAALLELSLDQGRALQAASRDECGRFFLTGATNLDLTKTFSSELQARDLTVTARLLEQAAIKPYRATAEADPVAFQQSLTRATVRMRRADAAAFDAWVAANMPANDLAANCLLTIALYEELLSLPADEAARVFRSRIGSR